MQIPSDFSQRIKQLRASFSLTQAYMAKLMGVTQAVISQWESGEVTPSPKRWKQIVRAETLGQYALARDYAPDQAVKDLTAGYSVTPDAASHLDFTAEAETVRLVVQAYRLSYGHLANPTFATEISQIQPLPHQRLAVYERMLPQPRLRFLLADDAGAGKTIMAGLYIREMLSRRLLRRVLIVPPAGLVGNWRKEMHTLFSLPFHVAAGADAKTDNPFTGPESDLLIVSVDTLASDRMFARLQEPDVEPYDLVIFDEAHKLSADRDQGPGLRKTNRYRLAEAMAGVPGQDARWELDWSCQHLLLMTATPHMGKFFPYYCLWRLLEPEALSTLDAFQALPHPARQAYFIRRTKEEMVDFHKQPIYPLRTSDTLSYELTQGEVSEQRLYDETTDYINTYYNRARILNRSAARLAMSIFQRRLASSTYALLCSMENRLARLEGWIEAIQSGQITLDELMRRQQSLDSEAHDILDETTADEEEGEGEREQNQAAEELALGGVVAATLADLEVERHKVAHLCGLARQVYEDDKRQDSKFARLLEVLRDPKYKDEKLIVFTEHRDTQAFLVRRLEQLGYAGEIAQIHGGMPYKERDAQVEFFRLTGAKGGARLLVATDAAGEGINLQFCWLMVNYDVPWNPARLEQRMGRVHRYGQEHDPVMIINLVAGKTREGKVIKTLLDKLEEIRHDLGRDKVFDVVGQLFENKSLKAYMEQALTEEGAEAAIRELNKQVSRENVQALEEEEKQVYGETGDARDELGRLQTEQAHNRYRKLLPGHVQRFVEQAAPRLGIGIEGELDGYFALRPLETGALDPLWGALEDYSAEQRQHLTVYPELAGPGREAVFVRPGEAVFERLMAYFFARFGPDALKGGIFVDPTAGQPYLFHLALVEVMCRRDPKGFENPLGLDRLIETRLVGLKQDEAGHIETAPLEHLLLLRGGAGPGSHINLVAQAATWREVAQAYVVEHVAGRLADEHRAALLEALPGRRDFIRRGYDYRRAELAGRRSHLKDKAKAGDGRAKQELARVKQQQRALEERCEAVMTAMEREPEWVAPGAVSLLAHALVIPSDDPQDRKRYDAAVELTAVREAWAYEEARGAEVIDVSTPELARAAGLEDNPGFDLLSFSPLPPFAERATGEGTGVRAGSPLPLGEGLGVREDGLRFEERAIEVKGRARVGDVELSENEWIKAVTHLDRYWLYVVYNCATPKPQLWRVHNPFKKKIGLPKGGWVIDEQEILNAAEE